jgi:chromosome segregation ATPase
MKVQAMVEGAQREKEQALVRIASLEQSLKSDLARFMAVEQDYARIKEDEATKDKMLIDFRASSERYFAQLQLVTTQFDSLQVLYDNQTVLADQQKEQIALAVSKIDEATRARRLAEDRIEELKTRLDEATESRDELTTELASGKREVDKIRSQMAELERETEVLEMKRRTSEKQFETQKEMLASKVKNLTEILNAERKIRENWIEKFENEQKSNSDNIREMMEMRRQCNDLQMQLATMTSKRDETLKRLDAERMHAAEARNKANQLKNKVEEAERKSFTLGHLVEQMEVEWGKKLQAAESRYQADLEEIKLFILQERMVAEDYRSRAEGNLRNCYFLQETIELQRHALEKIRMSYEDICVFYHMALNNVTLYADFNCF